MSKYNSYAKKLDQAFRDAREKYAGAYGKLQEAKQELDSSKQFHKEKRIGENEIRKKKAEVKYEEAKAEFESVQKTAWSEYESTVKQLTRDLNREIKKDNVATSDALDDHALKLLESGVMNADDYVSMAEQFDNNPTMLRFISKHARELGDSTKDEKDRGRLYMVAEQTRSGGNKVQRDWDDLVKCADVYAGQTRPHNDPGFIVNMNQHWDEKMQDSIDSF